MKQFDLLRFALALLAVALGVLCGLAVSAAVILRWTF
jgi:hypothetical protein